MRIETLTIALMATLAIACVPPRSKGPKKEAPITVEANGGDGKDDMPDDALSNQPTPDNNAVNNDLPTNAVDGPVCGDGIVEGSESCDGAVDITCEELGFDGGFTGCSNTCQVDTDGCTRMTCGDGVVQDNEVCDDGEANGGYDACSSNCSGLDQFCGDGELNGPEACDGAALAGVTCTSLGFDGGTIACGTTCELDTSGCSSCGDGVVQPGEACDDGALNGTYGNCNALCMGMGATCGDGVRNGPEECDGGDVSETCASLGAGRGSLGCDASCTFDVNTCSDTPAAGDVIISEIMQNPAMSLDNDGEYFELFNTTASTLNLNGCSVQSSTSSGPESFNIAGDVRISPGGYAVFARSVNAPFAADYTYGGLINLNNSVDELAIRCDGIEVDYVSYDDGATFPDPEGASMSLNPARMSASQNDLGSNWCMSSSTFGVGDLGTPGGPNDPCF